MPEATALKCWLCGRVGPGVKLAVKTGDFVGEYHLIPRCADIEGCLQRMFPGHALIVSLNADGEPKPRE